MSIAGFPSSKKRDPLNFCVINSTTYKREPHKKITYPISKTPAFSSKRALPTSSPNTRAAIKSKAVNWEICVLPKIFVKANSAQNPKIVSYKIGINFIKTPLYINVILYHIINTYLYYVQS